MAKTEITVQVFEDIKDVKAKLRNLGYEEVEEFTGDDGYFSTLSKEEVAKADYQELLSHSLLTRAFKTKGSDEKVQMLLFKDKTLDSNGNVISEEKVSTSISNVDNCKRALVLAGLTNWVNLHQQNAIYKKGEIELIVGTVEGLEGTFMEIEEYPSLKELDSNTKFERLKEFANSFDFKLGNNFSVKKVYMLFKSK